MANTTNIMSIAPNQPASSTRRTSQSTQPKYKPAARQGKKNFGATFDKVNAKIDEVKQGVQDLQDTGKKLTQVESDAKPIDDEQQQSAQGTSDTPQDATQKAIRNEELGTVNDSKLIAEEVSTADIFFRADETVGEKSVETATPEVETQIDEQIDEQKIPDAIKPLKLPLKNLLWQKIFGATTPAQPEQKLPEGDNSTAAPTEIQAQPVTFAATANISAYFFAQNSEILPTAAPVDTLATSADAIKLDAAQKLQPAQSLQTLLPQPENNSRSMLNLLGGKSWRLIETPPAQIQPTLQAQAQPAQIQPTLQVQAQPAQIQPTLQVQAQPAQIQPTLQVQAQPVEIQPTLQAQAQPEQIQPTVQTQVQPAEIQPQLQVQAQPAQLQPTVQLQAQSAEIQPTVQLQAQPEQIQPQLQVQTQPEQIQPQLQVQAQPAEIQPQVQAQPQPIEIQPQAQVQVQPAEIQPQAQVQVQPAEIQPQLQVQAQPEQIQPQLQVQVQPAQIQPQLQAQPQPEQIQPQLQVQPQVQVQAQPAEIQPTLQAQPQPEQIQPNVQTSAQPAEIQPTLQAQPQPEQIQPTVQLQTQPAQVQQTVQYRAQPAQLQPQVQVQVQPEQIHQTVQYRAQPVAQQRIDAPPAQNLSEMPGVNVPLEEAPTAAPVTAPQAAPQHFTQDNTPQRDAQNFQGQIFTAPTETQAQPVSTGGEIFSVPLTTSDAPQTQPTTPTQVPDEPPPPPQDNFDVPAQIVRQARLIRTAENTEMVIKLNPEHLGNLTLKISVSANGAVNASFHSDNAQVRTIIENSLVQLRQELNNQGLKVENVQVYAGLSEDGGLMNGQGGQAWQQNRQQRQGNRRITIETLERDMETTSAENIAAEGVDYSV